jgi:hypothetical protein
MEQEVLRHLIRSKLADGRLPQDSIPRLWGGAGNGETCDACEEIITKTQFVMEGVSAETGGKGIQFHVGCLHLWDSERWAPGRDAQMEPCAVPDPLCAVCGKAILSGEGRYRHGAELSVHRECEQALREDLPPSETPTREQ